MSGSYIIDAIVVLAVLGMVITNARRGLAKSAAAVVGGIVALILSAAIAPSIAPVIYDDLISESLTKQLSKRISEFDSAEIISEKLFNEKYGVKISEEVVRSAILSSGDTEKQLVMVLKNEAGKDISGDEISDFFKEEGIELLKSSEDKSIFVDQADEMFDVIEAFAEQDKSRRVEKVEEMVVKPLITRVIRLLVAVFLFIIISAIISQIIKKLDFMDRIHVVGVANHVLGGVLGAAEAIMLLVVFTFAVKAIFLMGGELISEKVINDTHIFRLFYNLNL